MSRALTFLAAALALLVGTAATAADPLGVSIGVARFAVDPGTDATDPAPSLTELLAEQPGVHVVGPAELEGVDPEQIRAFAAESALGAVVEGSSQADDAGTRVEARLRSGETGAVVGAYAAEWSDEDARGPALARLAEQIVEGAAALRVDPTIPPVSAGQGERFGLGLEGDGPLSIVSDELEAERHDDGGRRLIFTQNVEVTQADVRITTDRLVAEYPPEAKDPHKLVAVGHVVMRQGDREARCDRATYLRTRDELVCRGRAELRDGVDVVQGDRIEFDLARDKVRVLGGARLELEPREAAPAGAEAAAADAVANEAAAADAVANEAAAP